MSRCTCLNLNDLENDDISTDPLCPIHGINGTAPALPKAPDPRLRLDIPAVAFQPTGGFGVPTPNSDHLLATVTINGVAFHVDAYAVRMVNGVQTADQLDEDLADIHRIVGADGPFQTIRIGRRYYVLVLTPHC
jgi:hypothetical protein